MEGALGNYLDNGLPRNEEEEENVLIEYVKEKDNLKVEISNKDKEIQKYKARVYDLQEKNDQLENRVKELQKTIDSTQASSNKSGTARPLTARTPQMQRARSAKQRGKTPVPPRRSNSKKNDSPAGSPVVNGTSSEETDKWREDAKALVRLKEIAQKFPELKLSVILTSETFFKESDINNDGTIDMQELENLLMKGGHLFTNKELAEIMNQIDVDKSGSIDFMEYLMVMDRIQQRKRVNLPQTLTRSKTCKIQ
ncbi:uncharacterized protein LOC143461746 [Clavelina lepadiformis]|uniref:EF-hand domain-containing protein n=1 Tax=Clavelina lepadiformis TaxID=159417 RepID=A0ABP0GMD8_CLALP